jgi:hypothetical protein
MVCPKCKFPNAIGLNCQRCGYGISPVPEPEEKKHTDADVKRLTAASDRKAGETRARLQVLNDQYTTLLRTHAQLQKDHAALRQQMTKNGVDVAEAIKPSPVVEKQPDPARACKKCGLPEGAYVQHECAKVEA